jgi:hypothetical protein
LPLLGLRRAAALGEEAHTPAVARERARELDGVRAGARQAIARDQREAVLQRPHRVVPIERLPIVGMLRARAERSEREQAERAEPHGDAARGRGSLDRHEDGHSVSEGARGECAAVARVHATARKSSPSR